MSSGLRIKAAVDEAQGMSVNSRVLLDGILNTQSVWR
jgi:flagellin-like hook-associated protein FlgL